jgi:hypothetical protein
MGSTHLQTMFFQCLQSGYQTCWSLPGFRCALPYQAEPSFQATVYYLQSGREMWHIYLVVGQQHHGVYQQAQEVYKHFIENFTFSPQKAFLVSLLFLSLTFKNSQFL